MTTNRTITLSEFRTLGEEDVDIATVEDRIELALALAYLSPPKATVVRAVTGDPTEPLTQHGVTEGWQPTKNLLEAAKRLGRAVTALERLDEIVAQGEVEGGSKPAPQHASLVVIDGEDVLVAGQRFVGLPGTRPSVTPFFSLRRDDGGVVLVTRYRARCVARPS